MPGRGSRSSRSSRSVRLGLLTIVAGAVALTACMSDQPGSSDGKPASNRERLAAAWMEAEPEARIAISPSKDKKVRPDEVIEVATEGGMLTDVTMTDQDGDRVAGTFDETKATWQAAPHLDPDSTYRIQARAINSDGAVSAVSKKFRTLEPSNVLRTEIRPSDGSTVGVGMPIVVEFTEPVKSRATVEEQLEVETSKPVEGAWHWFNDREVHYRPKEYWPAHTEVTVHTNLKGVSSGAGAWGVANETRTFTVARSVVTRVNLFEHVANVYINGEPVRTIPVSGGKPGWETRDGTKVILAFERDKRFTNEQINAPEDYDLTSAYAIRVTWSGEFLHTATWSVGQQGRANTSHGCIGMNTSNSAWLYKVTHIGDPVEFETSGSKMPVYGNGYGDWNMSWSDWKAGSALT